MRKHRGIVASLIIAGTGLAGLSITTVQAINTSPSPVDSSQAVRYNADGTPIGNIIFEFIEKDDERKNIDAPFPLNFFGNRLPALCLSTNGLVYPIQTVSSNCSARYDRNLEALTIQSRADSIASLALDIDVSEKLHNPHRESVDEVQITDIVVTTTDITVTTAVAHGFRVGELARMDSNPSLTGAVSSRRITAVPSATSFTIDNTNSTASSGMYTPAAGDRAVAWRETILERVTNLSLAGTTLTVTVNGNADFGAGGKFTFTGTGIAGLDQQKFTVASRVGTSQFTVTVPGTVTDVDASQPGDQTAAAFTDSTLRPWALERDEVGAFQQLYSGATTVDGRDAYSLTWYRVPNNDSSTSGINGGYFPAINPKTLSLTFQLLIIKRETGSDATGWDFDYEFNIGHATDPSDGYKAADPNNACLPSSLTDCRWGMGTARLIQGPEVSTVENDGTVITFDTATPHNLTAGQFIGAHFCLPTAGLCLNARDASGQITVVDADTITIPSGSVSPFVQESHATGSRLLLARSWELFANTPSPDLIDAGGSTALVRNSLNSDVLGRYTFAMINGEVTNFVAPTMGAGISGTVADTATTAPPASTTVPATTVAPTNTTMPAGTVAPTTTPVAAPVTAPVKAQTTLRRPRELPAAGVNTNGRLVWSLAFLVTGALLARRKRWS